MEQLPESVFQSDKAAVLLQDSWLNPLRIHLEEKVSRSELPKFLIWKLKRFLPYAADQAEIRHIDLGDGHYLTFTLPKPWLQDLYQALADKGVACGYIGGLASTLLENRPYLTGKLSLCLFADTYVLCEQNEQGGYLDFRLRRLPYNETQLDVETLVKSDLGPLMQKSERPLTAINFEPRLAGDFKNLSNHLSGSNMTELHGPTLARFQSCWNGQGGLS